MENKIKQILINWGVGTEEVINEITLELLILFESHIKEDSVITEARKIWNSGNPSTELRTIKYMMQNGWGLKDAYEYCETNFK